MELRLGEKEYFFLMHKDDIVTSLHIDTSTGIIDQIGKNVVPELLPLGERKSAEALKKWWKRRTNQYQN